jgi:hypothetical protein
MAAMPHIRKRHLVIAALVLLALCLGGSFVYFSLLSEQQLRDVLDETERLDPGWTIRELQAKRIVVPEEQNSAEDLINGRALVPQKWPFWEMSRADSTLGLSQDELDKLRDSFENLEPPHQLDESQINALRKELAKAKASLTELRKIIDKPRGRYPLTFSKDSYSTRLADTQNTRRCANLLGHDILLKAQDRDMAGAFQSCRCIINAQRAIGDEPTVISMLVRIAIRTLAGKNLERILAQGQLAEADLAGMQRLLEEEEREPLLLIAARGERALADGFLEAVQKREIPLNSMNQKNFDKMEALYYALSPGTIRRARVALLRFNNEFVELAKLPINEQNAKLQSMRTSIDDLPKVARLIALRREKLTEAFHRDIAYTRCAIALVATERFRLANGRWPERVEELVPAFLANTLTDPFNGKPLRMLRAKEGLVIYSIGEDGVDNGGQLDQRPPRKAFDRGYRLWDVSNRRQSPKSTNAKE